MGENETHDLSDLQQRFVSEVAAVGLFLSAETLEALARTVLFGSRYAWLRANWHRIVTQTRWRDDDGPSEVVAIELSGICMRPVDGASLDRAIDEAMKPNANSASDDVIDHVD